MNESQSPSEARPVPGLSEAEPKNGILESESLAEEIVDQEIAEEDDELAQLRLELDEVRAREAQYLDGWQRARAELDNARKRFRREQEQVWTVALADTLARVLPIVDDMERAFGTLPDEFSEHPWVEGVVLIQRKLEQLLEQAGVEPVEVEDEEFDPFSHQAVTHEPSETVPAGHIIAELQKGYRMGDRVLRPSMVRVSSGPVSEGEPQMEPEPDIERDARTEEPEAGARN